jgi:hypothetical protein
MQVVAQSVFLLPQNGVARIAVVLKTDILPLNQEIGGIDDMVVRLIVVQATDPGEAHPLSSPVSPVLISLIRIPLQGFL